MTTTSLDERKRTHLELLAILHYAHGAIIGVGAAALIAVFGSLWLVRRGTGVPELLVGVVLPGLLVAYAALNLLAGRWLVRRRHWVTIVALSAFNSLSFPLGTLLGVFTIVVLADDGVRTAFGGRRLSG